MEIYFDHFNVSFTFKMLTTDREVQAEATLRLTLLFKQPVNLQRAVAAGTHLYCH